YIYELAASTGGGTSVSDRYVVHTPASCPAGIPPPHNVTVAGARSLFLAWSSPGVQEEDGGWERMRGECGCQQRTGAPEKTGDDKECGKWSLPGRRPAGPLGVGPLALPDLLPPSSPSPPSRGVVQEVSVYGLQPYTEYSLRVEAVNSAGDVSSEWRPATRTLEASPAGAGALAAEDREQGPGSGLLECWDPPHTPNGVITGRLGLAIGVVLMLAFAEHPSSGQYGQPPPRPLSIGPNQVSLTWDPPSEPNGPIEEYALLGRSLEDEARGRSNDEDLNNEKVLFTQDHPGDAISFSYTAGGLRPWTRYQFSVRSHNRAGHALSTWVTVTTKQAPPSGLAPPTVTHIAERPRELLVSWAPPLQSNGVLLSYRVQRDNVSFPFSFDPAVTRHNDEDVAPFTTYSYAVTACTSEGCVTSPPTHATTLEAPPTTVVPPAVGQVTAQSLTASWDAPPGHSGRVTEYALQLDGQDAYRGRALSSVVSELRPHTSYQLALLACTSGGCTSSTAVTIVTGEAPPTGLQPPTVKVTGPESVEVSWSPPEQPNGIVTGYELRRDGEVVYVGPETRYHDFTLLPNVGYSYVVAANNSQGAASSVAAVAKTHSSAPSGVGPPTLQPLGPSQVNEYEVRVEACTALGCSSSDWASILTPESPPAGQTAPLLDLQPDTNTGLHTTFLLTWSPPAHPNGVILHYEVYRNLEHTIDTRGGAPRARQLAARANRGAHSAAAAKATNDGALVQSGSFQKPFVAMVRAVNSAGHSASPWANGRTGPAPPEGIAPPTFQRIQATWAVVDILPPRRPNGIVSLYRVFSQDNNTYILLSEGTSQQQTLHGLSPYTLYWVGVQACTCYQCCRRGPLSQLLTPPAPPARQSPPRPRTLASRSVHLEWDAPLAPNGVIERDQIETCFFGNGGWGSSFLPYREQGGRAQAVMCRDGGVAGLLPHFSYKLRVASFNSMGSTASNWTDVTTHGEAPLSPSPCVVTSVQLEAVLPMLLNEATRSL
ncbi:hypothetical protein CRUP_006281, partial [Coryphaenoides rupestris]